jgi:hypothetical protein
MAVHVTFIRRATSVDSGLETFILIEGFLNFPQYLNEDAVILS